VELRIFQQEFSQSQKLAAGIYHFSVSIAKEGYSLEAIQTIQIYFHVNGHKIDISGIGGIYTVAGAPVAIPSNLKLEKGMIE